jgi:hydroxymethylglutaryl-CoA reductase (NADPH)
MSIDYRHVREYLNGLLASHSEEELVQRLRPKPGPAAPRVPGGARLTPQAVERRWRQVPLTAESRRALLDPQTEAQLPQFEHNIENFIGTAKLPVGLAGPLRVNGLFAQGDYYVPLATVEATLVACYHRGALLITEAGGCAALVLSEGVSRAPGFAFADVASAARFVVWATAQLDEFKRVAEATTRHGRLTDLRVTIEGNHVYLGFEYFTGDAMGQNMVTFATQAVCDHILAHSPVKPEHHFLEANLSGDKKASAQSFLLVRGKKVTAEVTLPAALVEKHLRTTPAQMADYWRMSAIGGVLSGTMGVQGHFANGLTALYLACGQDAACAAESATGVTRFEVTTNGALYAAVTLPNLMVSTVGGGTGLPSQRACLEILGLVGPDKARALAEVCAGLVLAGELSIAGAMCAQVFAQAHDRLARGRKS